MFDLHPAQPMRYPAQSTSLMTTLLLLALSITVARVQADDVPQLGCNEKPFFPAKIRCFIDAAQATKDAGVCEGAVDPVVRFHCFSLYAERSLDPDYCKRIVFGEEQTNAMRAACVSGVAAARRDPALCEQIELTAARDSCYLMLVVQFQADPSFCRRITESTVRNACGH